VTAILPLSESLVVTGSYDDHLRILQTNQGGRPQILAEQNLGGGVWRIKIIEGRTVASGDLERIILLVSCMYAGARVVELAQEVDAEQSTWKIRVLAAFDEHKSMNYGSDFQPGSSTGQKTIVSTSFYDRLLCVWQYPP